MSNEKATCMCGSKSCTGYLGGFPKKNGSQFDIDLMENKVIHQNNEQNLHDSFVKERNLREN